MSANPPFELFTIPALPLESGAVLPDARLAFRQSGRVGEGEPVLACTAFGATPLDLAYLAAPGGPLDPNAVWLVQVEMLGNGRSSSPSDTPAPRAGPDFPAVSIRDNVALQAALLDHLGVARVRCVVGASMGGQQAVQWAASHPERVGGAVVIAGNARTTLYGRLFLHTVRQALVGAPDFRDGRYESPPLEALSRLSETWAPFALSPRFFSTGRHRAHPDMDAPNLEGFLAKWRTRYHTRDANDLLLQLDAWARHDIAGTPGCGGSFAAAAARAAAPILFLPIATDLYFHPDDVREQAAHFPRAQLEVIDSLSGHAAAFGREPEDRAAIADAVGRFLATL